MEIIEIFNSVEYWFGLATGVAVYKIAKQALQSRIGAVIGGGSSSNEKKE